MFAQLIEEVRVVLEKIKRSDRGTRSKRRENKLAKRYAGLSRTTDSYSGQHTEIGRAIAKDVAVSKKSGKTPLKGGEVSWMRVHRDRPTKESVSRRLAEKVRRSDRDISPRTKRRRKELTRRYQGLERTTGAEMATAAPYEVHKRSAKTQAGYATSHTGSTGNPTRELRKNR